MYLSYYRLHNQNLLLQYLPKTKSSVKLFKNQPLERPKYYFRRRRARFFFGVFVGTVLVGTVLVGTVLVGTGLVGTVLVGTVLVGTVLVGAVLVGAVLVGAAGLSASLFFA
jgi:uncharacterized protein YjbI with pentapeptide repeats